MKILNILSIYTLIVVIYLHSLPAFASTISTHEMPVLDGLIFRPHFGYGMLDDDSVYHYGGRILLPASDIRRYGLEITQFVDNHDESFSSIGIVLEQRLFKWFNLSIGTIGYFDYGLDSENIVGLMTNLGWEPDNYKSFKPYITYRNDVIFGDNTDTIHSLSIGFSWEF
jgi:hypothetical protein